MPLSEAKIRKLLSAGEPTTVNDSRALFLSIGKRQASWFCRHTRNGQTVKTVIGHYPAMGPERARRERDRITGRDTDLGVTVSEVVSDYRRLVTDKQKSGDQSEVYLRHLEAEYGNRKAAAITRANLVSMVSRYAQDRGARSADRLLSQLRGVFNLAVEMGYAEQSPLTGVTKRITGYEPNPRARVLSDDEIRTLWGWEHHHGALCRFLLLTGLRISEAQKGAREGHRWHIPAQYSKNGKSHWVYLTKTAIAQLGSPFETSPTAVQAWLKRRSEVDGWTPHDLRRTAATRMAEAGVEPFVVERCLGHTLQGVMAVYNQHDYETERVAAAEVLEKALLRVLK